MLVAAGLSGSADRAAAETPVGITRTEELVYGRKDGLALTLDAFVPAKGNGAGLLFIVNGGWLSSKPTPLMVTIRPDDDAPFLARGSVVFAVVTSSQPLSVAARGAAGSPDAPDPVDRASAAIQATACFDRHLRPR